MGRASPRICRRSVGRGRGAKNLTRAHSNNARETTAWTILQTPRLRLQMFREDHFDSYADKMADPEVTRYLPQGGPLSRPEARRNMAAALGHWQLRG